MAMESPGDGVYGATIPASASTATGRWCAISFHATDANGRASRWPLFTNPTGTAQYLGTVVNPNYVTSAIPVIHLFAQPNVLQPGPNTSQTGADSQAGSSGVSAFYDGEFYDNVFVALRGKHDGRLSEEIASIRIQPRTFVSASGCGIRLAGEAGPENTADFVCCGLIPIRLTCGRD